LPGAPPQTQLPLGELIALPRPPSWILGALLLREGEEKRGEGREGGRRGPISKEGRMGRGKGKRREKREGKEGDPQWLVHTRAASFDYFRNRLIDTNNRL